MIKHEKDKYIFTNYSDVKPEPSYTKWYGAIGLLIYLLIALFA